MTDLDEKGAAHLRRAIELAVESGRLGNRPFGAVAVGIDGGVIAQGINSVASGGNPTEHAELTTITAAWRANSIDALAGATMYASGEPCPMCAAAMVWAGITRIVFGAATEQFSPLLPGGPQFQLTCADVIGFSDAAVEVSGPHLGEEALAPFYKYRESC